MRDLFVTCLVCSLWLVGLAPSFAEDTAAPTSADVYSRPSETLKITAAIPRNWPPHFTTDSSGNPDGFAIESMKEIARLANVDVRYISYNLFIKAVDALREKKVDIIPNVGIVDFRKKYALFSPPLETFLVSAFVRSGRLTTQQLGENWLDLLKNHTTGVVINNVGQRVLAKNPEVPTVIYKNVHEAIIDLIAGRLDALVYPQAVVNRIIRSIGLSEKIQVAGTPIREIKRGIATRNDKPELHKRLSLAVDQFVKSPKYEEIYIRWFGTKKAFWTTRHLIIYIGIPVVIIFVLLVIWRYYSVTKLNKRLFESRESLSRLNVELENRVVERTHDIAREKLRAENFLNIAGTMIVALDSDGKVSLVNRKGCEVLGYEVDEIIGKNWIETFIPQCDRASTRKVFLSFKDGEHEPEDYYQNHILIKEGGERLISWNSTCVLDEDGNFAGYLSAGEDITDRQAAEQSLIEAHQINETIFSGSPVGIAMYDDTGQCVSSNDAVGNIIGATHEQVLAQNYHKVESWKECGLLDKARKCLSTGERVRHEILVKSSFGKKISLDCHLVPIKTNGEQHLLLMLNDITEHKLMQAQLIQSSKMATLGEMATGVAHELNQPLNVIRMAVSNIQRKSKNNKAEPKYLSGKLEKIDSQIERASAIIDHMRIFGRKSDATPEQLDPKKVVQSTLGLIGEQLRLANINVISEGPVDCHCILGHQVQIEQVLLNLIGNARDSLQSKEDGDKRISITVGENDASVFIAVEDTGGGIAKDDLSRVFEPFFTSKEVGKGTGLGLSISYGIINDMGGTITAANTDDGARFVVTLPQCKEEISQIS